MNWMVRADFPTPGRGDELETSPKRKRVWRTTTADNYQLIFPQKLSLYGKKGRQKRMMRNCPDDKRKKRAENEKRVGLTLDI